MDGVIVDHGQPSVTMLAVFGAGGVESVYEANDNNNFDIVPPRGTRQKSICESCAFFIKEYNCKKNELQEKAASMKLYTCKKYFSKEDVKQAEGQ